MINKTILDFTISSELYDLYIIDNSQWGNAFDLPSVINITTPGRPLPVSMYFDKKEITAYDSKSLRLDCGNDCEKAELPDGIYHIEIKASPESIFKEYDYLKADILDRDIKRVYIDNIGTFSCENKCFRNLMEADFLLKTAQSYILFGDTKNAIYYYNESKRIVDKLLCSDCKGKCS